MLNLVYQDNSYELLNILIYKTPFGKFKKLKKSFSFGLYYAVNYVFFPNCNILMF